MKSDNNNNNNPQDPPYEEFRVPHRKAPDLPILIGENGKPVPEAFTKFAWHTFDSEERFPRPLFSGLYTQETVEAAFYAGIECRNQEIYRNHNAAASGATGSSTKAAADSSDNEAQNTPTASPLGSFGFGAAAPEPSIKRPDHGKPVGRPPFMDVTQGVRANAIPPAIQSAAAAKLILEAATTITSFADIIAKATTLTGFGPLFVQKAEASTQTSETKIPTSEAEVQATVRTAEFEVQTNVKTSDCEVQTSEAVVQTFEDKTSDPDIQIVFESVPVSRVSTAPTKTVKMKVKTMRRIRKKGVRLVAPPKRKYTKKNQTAEPVAMVVDEPIADSTDEQPPTSTPATVSCPHQIAAIRRPKSRKRSSAITNTDPNARKIRRSEKKEKMREAAERMKAEEEERKKEEARKREQRAMFRQW